MTTTASTYELFIQALNVTNAAMEANRNSLVLKPMLAACSLELTDQDFSVEIHDGDPDAPVDFFKIRMVGGTFVLVSHLEKPKPEDESAWRVSVDYLRDVADHPRRYVENPALLAFDWLKQRLGFAA